MRHDRSRRCESNASSDPAQDRQSGVSHDLGFSQPPLSAEVVTHNRPLTSARRRPGSGRSLRQDTTAETGPSADRQAYARWRDIRSVAAASQTFRATYRLLRWSHPVQGSARHMPFARISNSDLGGSATRKKRLRSRGSNSLHLTQRSSRVISSSIASRKRKGQIHSAGISRRSMLPACSRCCGSKLAMSYPRRTHRRAQLVSEINDDSRVGARSSTSYRATWPQWSRSATRRSTLSLAVPVFSHLSNRERTRVPNSLL